MSFYLNHHWLILLTQNIYDSVLRDKANGKNERTLIQEGDFLVKFMIMILLQIFVNHKCNRCTVIKIIIICHRGSSPPPFQPANKDHQP